MDNTLKPFQPLIPQTRVQPSKPVATPAASSPVAETKAEPQESFQSQAVPPYKTEVAPAEAAPTPSKAPQPSVEMTFSWQQGDVTFQAEGNSGPITSFANVSPTLSSESLQATSLESTLQAVAAAQMEKAETAKAMGQRESLYLERVPFKNDEKALKTRAAISARYHDASTSAESVSKTISSYAAERGVELEKVPQGLSGDFAANSQAVRTAAQGVVDKFFLSESASMNPEKHATVSEQTSRFLDLAMQAAPEDFSAADAYKLVASNLALISYQDKAAAENMLGDHGVRHLLGHNIKATEQLADGLEEHGVPVGAKDRLVLHQAMIVHDLGYAMDSVRDPINAEGIKGQDAGHNVLAARYLKERALDPQDPLNKLFASADLEAMHRCVLYHDKDVDGGPGVDFTMASSLTPEQRSMNLETMTRVADNSHAFEDKLPELLYREPKALKTLRLMKSAGELGDEQLLQDLKADLSSDIAENPTLAKDDKEALLKSANSLGPESYRFSVGRIAGSKPTFDVRPDGTVVIDVMESDTHQQTVGMFGLASYNQMEKFILDCTGQKTKLSGNDEVIEGGGLAVNFRGGAHRVEGSEAFNQELNSELLADKAFVKFSFLDTSLGAEQKVLAELASGGDVSVQLQLDDVKSLRRELLEQYRNQA